jgi:hypothetical protein
MGPAPLRKVEREVSSPVTNSRQVLSAANDGNATTYIGRISPTETTRPRDAAIRQVANENQSIRQVRTTTAPASTYPTVDQEFAASYNEQSSMRPSVGDMMDYTNDNRGRSRGGSTIRKSRTDLTPTTKGSSVMRNTSVQKGLVSKDKMKKLAHAHNMNDVASAILPGKTGAYVTATEAAGELFALWPIYVFGQLPLAVLSLVSLALAGAFEKTKEMATSSTVGEFLWNIGAGVVKIINGVLDYFLGFDLSVFDPNTWLVVFTALTIFVLWAQYLIGAIVYNISGIYCLNGKASTWKYIFVMLGLVAGVIPFMNLLPWAGFWILVVTANPTDDD